MGPPLSASGSPPPILCATSASSSGRGWSGQPQVDAGGEGHAWYDTELRELHHESSVLLLRQKAALSTASSSSSSGGARGETPKEFGNLALFPTQLAPFYSEDLADLADQIAGLLDTNAHALPSGLLAQALLLLFNSKDAIDAKVEMEWKLSVLKRYDEMEQKGDIEVICFSCNCSYFSLMLFWWSSIKCCNLHI